MKEFAQKTAVITGAAHGIGRSLAIECYKRGMNVVISDIDMPYLYTLEKELRDRGAHVLSTYCDVTDYKQVELLEREARHMFGNVHMLINNAGVIVTGDFVSLPIKDWEYCVRTNLYGPYHCMKVFLPNMLAMDEEGCIVNMAALAGVMTAPGMPAYYASKHALVGLSESIGTTLPFINAKIRLTIVCPGAVKTDMNNGDSRRPFGFRANWFDDYYSSPEYKAGKETLDYSMTAGIDPEHVAVETFKAVEKELLYTVVSDEDNKTIRKILENRAGTYLGEEVLNMTILEKLTERVL